MKFYVIDFLLFVIEVLTYQNFGSYVLSVAFHPTKNLLASCCADKTIRTWDITSGSCLSTLRDENASCMSHIFSLAFSPDGQLIAAGEGNPYTSSEAGAVRIYCASTGQVKRALNVGYYAPFSLD